MIDIVYKPSFSGNQRRGVSGLRKKGQLEADYDLNEYNLPDGVEVGVTYLKAFISSEYVDLSHLEKSSPFDRSSAVVTSAATIVDSSALPQASTSPEVDTLRLRGGKMGGIERSPSMNQIWDTLLVPIIIKRKAPHSSSDVVLNQ